MITYYSKKGCAPCKKYYPLFEKLFASDKYYQKVEVETDEEALETVKKFNTRTFPFAVVHRNVVIPTDDLIFMLIRTVAKNI